MCAVSAFVCIVCECQSETEEEQKTVGIWRERERHVENVLCGSSSSEVSNTEPHHSVSV